MKVELRDITEKNFDECIKLEVADHQKDFVATNTMSIAQSKVLPETVIKAVYDVETMVGFVMLGLDKERDRRYLVRLMIDKNQQGKGYGRAATNAVVERVKKIDGCEALYLCCVPGNDVAEKLYESIGFEKTGEMDEGEIEMVLTLG